MRFFPRVHNQFLPEPCKRKLNNANLFVRRKGWIGLVEWGGANGLRAGSGSVIARVTQSNVHVSLAVSAYVLPNTRNLSIWFLDMWPCAASSEPWQNFWLWLLPLVSQCFIGSANQFASNARSLNLRCGLAPICGTDLPNAGLWPDLCQPTTAEPSQAKPKVELWI